MAFDKKKAEQCIVEVRPTPRSFGMGCRLLDDELVVTACHCLRRGKQDFGLPEPHFLGADPVTVKVRKFGTRACTPLLVRFADPCSDIAVLGISTADGTDMPGSLFEAAGDLLAALEPAVPELDAPTSAKVFLFTHEKRWLTGRARGSWIELDRGQVVRSGTSGSPVFTEQGRVLGLVTNSAEMSPSVRMSLLAENLPRWLIRRARDIDAAKSGGAPSSLREAMERASRRSGASAT